MGIINWMVLNWFKVKYQFDEQDKWSFEFQQWHITKEWTSKIGVGATQIILDSAKINFSIWECLKYNFSLKLIWTVKSSYWYAGGIFQAMKVNGILKSQDKNNDGYVDYFEFSKAQEERNAKNENQT